MLSALLTEMDGMGGKEQDGLGSGNTSSCVANPEPQNSIQNGRMLEITRESGLVVFCQVSNPDGCGSLILSNRRAQSR